MGECYRRPTDRQTTDGRAIAYSEREREFTFAENLSGSVKVCRSYSRKADFEQIHITLSCIGAYA